MCSILIGRFNDQQYTFIKAILNTDFFSFWNWLCLIPWDLLWLNLKTILAYFYISIYNKRNKLKSFLSSHGAFLKMLNGYYWFSVSSIIKTYCNLTYTFKDNLKLFSNISNRLMCMVLLGYMQKFVSRWNFFSLFRVLTETEYLMPLFCL